MLKMVDGTGIIGVDMICPLGVSTPQPPNYKGEDRRGRDVGTSEQLGCTA